MTKIAAFTIASKNFMAFVQTLNESLQRQHPGTPFYCVLCDDASDLDINSFPFEIIPIDALGIPNIDKMLTEYNITELNTALKPFAFSMLFDEHPDTSILYFDPDIFIYSELTELIRLLDNDADAVLIPHITQPAEYAEMSDREFLKYGIYNLGFCAFRPTQETRRAVSWWGRKLERECIIDLPNGLFVDQKWADLLPAFVGNTKILRHPGYNVAYWNLSYRKIRRSNEGWLVNGEPLRFFHFSGGSAEHSAPFSRHSSMFTMDRLGQAAQLVQEYRDTVQEFGHSYYKGMQYAFSWEGSKGQNIHTPKTAESRVSASEPPFMPMLCTQSQSEYRLRTLGMARLLNLRLEVEAKTFSPDSRTYMHEGFCSACGKPARFHHAAGPHSEIVLTNISLSHPIADFICGGCKLSGGVRGVLQAFRQKLKPHPASRILALNCDVATMSWLRKHFSNVTGSNFLSRPLAQSLPEQAIVEALPFEDNCFDFILALGGSPREVPIFGAACQELYRVNISGGAFILASSSFEYEDNTIRSIEHSEMAGAAGDEKSVVQDDYSGADNSWRLIESLKQAGYSKSQLLRYWSFEQKILGRQLAIIAQK